ncbi:MAG: hypothetical protein C0485_09945 [Pirellula sp.]|nr:hypothetical protein [Pirellula sp.]
MQTTLNPIGPGLKRAFDGLDATAKRARRHMVAARLHDRSGTSESVAAEVAEFQPLVEEGIRECDKNDADLIASVEEASATDTVGNFVSACDAALFNAPWLAERAVSLAARKLELAEKVVADLKILPAERRAEAEAVVAEIKKSLEELGCGVAAQQAAIHGNKGAAERQFDILARTTNLRSRQALAAVTAAEAELQIARQVASAARHELNAARETLVGIAKRALTG